MPARGQRSRRKSVPLIVGLALTLTVLLVAPAAPAGAYVNPYGRYEVLTLATGQCLTVPFNGVPGTWVIRANCTGQPHQIWHFDRVSTYNGDPVFVIRPTHRIGSNGEYADCLDLPYGDAYAGRPLWTWPCNGGLAQQWVQHTEYTPNQGWIYRYSSMASGTYDRVMQFNNGDAYPHLVMVPRRPLLDFPMYQLFQQRYVGP